MPHGAEAVNQGSTHMKLLLFTVAGAACYDVQLHDEPLPDPDDEAQRNLVEGAGGAYIGPAWYGTPPPEDRSPDL